MPAAVLFLAGAPALRQQLPPDTSAPVFPPHACPHGRYGARRGFWRTAKLFIGAGAPGRVPFHRRKRAGRGTLSAYLILCVRAFHLISSGTFGQCRSVLYFAPSTANSVISHAGMHGVRRR